MAVIHWVGGSSTHFNDPNNWNPVGLPNSTSDVIIGAGFTIDSPSTIRQRTVEGRATRRKQKFESFCKELTILRPAVPQLRPNGPAA